MVPKLSHQSRGGLNKMTFKSLISIHNRYSLVVVITIVRYLASALERKTTGYFLAYQETKFEPRKMLYPLVDRRSRLKRIPCTIKVTKMHVDEGGQG